MAAGALPRASGGLVYSGILVRYPTVLRYIRTVPYGTPVYPYGALRWYFKQSRAYTHPDTFNIGYLAVELYTVHITRYVAPTST